MSFRQLESLRKVFFPGSKWRRTKYPEQVITIVDVGITTKELEPMIIFRYNQTRHDLVWISNPDEFPRYYEPVFEFLE